MSAMSEWIVREYFEALGFLVRQPCKHEVAARNKRTEVGVELIVANPAVAAGGWPTGMVWSGADLARVGQAIVSVRGWHTERFSPKVLAQAPEIVRFAREDVVRKAARMLPAGPVAKILCIPDLAASRTLQARFLEELRAGGVDGVLLFRTILLELIARVEASKNYDKSDVLQLLRILKNYNLLKDAQMELFPTRRRLRLPISPDADAAPAPTP